MNLEDLLDAVSDEQSFLQFAEALKADKEDEDRKHGSEPNNPYSHGWNGWENNDIPGFLESAIAWAEDSGFGKHLDPEANNWKRFALFLYSGKTYE